MAGKTDSVDIKQFVNWAAQIAGNATFRRENSSTTCIDEHSSDVVEDCRCSSDKSLRSTVVLHSQSRDLRTCRVIGSKGL